MKIEEPFHGAVLNRRRGKEVPGGLEIAVSGKAHLRDAITVNGVAPRRQGESFHTTVVLREEQTEIAALAEGPRGRREHRVRVFWDKRSRLRYRFGIDDNSFFLRDIARKQYASLFDCFYLRMLKDFNAKYGAKFALNIYFATEDGFDLTQFPDRYRGEWADNAAWLKLAFHANADKPDRPYQYTFNTLAADFDRVTEQVLRFAGAQTYSPATILHWGMLPPEALPILYERGVRALTGYFRWRGSQWDVNYWLDDERSDYLARHDALMDFEHGIVFSCMALLCNGTPIEKIIPTLEEHARDPNRGEIMDIFTHEQYFWPFYQHYLPDHPQRLDTALRWVTEHGYQPVFFHEGFLGV